MSGVGGRTGLGVGAGLYYVLVNFSPVKSVSRVGGGLSQGVGGGGRGWNGVGVDKFALCSQVAGCLGTACREITVHHCNTKFITHSVQIAIHHCNTKSIAHSIQIIIVPCNTKFITHSVQIIIYHCNTMFITHSDSVQITIHHLALM